MKMIMISQVILLAAEPGGTFAERLVVGRGNGINRNVSNSAEDLSIDPNLKYVACPLNYSDAELHPKKKQSYMLSSNSQTLASTLASTVAFETATSLIHLNLKISEDKQLHQI